jgi:hypothetical protein
VEKTELSNNKPFEMHKADFKYSQAENPVEPENSIEPGQIYLYYRKGELEAVVKVIDSISNEEFSCEGTWPSVSREFLETEAKLFEGNLQSISLIRHRNLIEQLIN